MKEFYFKKLEISFQDELGGVCNLRSLSLVFFLCSNVRASGSDIGRNKEMHFRKLERIFKKWKITRPTKQLQENTTPIIAKFSWCKVAMA